MTVGNAARASFAALLAAALGCAGAPPRPGDTERPSRAPSATPVAPSKGVQAEPAPGVASSLPPRAQRLFEEAVRAEEEHKKSANPDWGYLERKWRSVADAADVAEAHHNLGVLLERQGKLGDARAQYERALELKPGLRQSAVNLGVLLEKQGDTRGAAAVYARCVQDFPEDGVSRARLAALYQGTGQIDEAWRLAREALAREPQLLTAYKVLARVSLQRNDLDLAKLVAMRAQKLDARDPELPYIVGQVLARQGDDAGAEAQFRSVLALAEGFLPARHALLEVALRKKAWGPVSEHAQAILKIEPGNAPVHLALGLALRYTGKADEALAAYDRAEKASGDRLAEVHLARGVLLARLKAECGPALAELRVYQDRAPVTPEGAQVAKLQQECEAQLEESRKAAEAAKQMQEEAARQAAAKAAEAEKAAAAAKAAEAEKAAKAAEAEKEGSNKEEPAKEEAAQKSEPKRGGANSGRPASSEGRARPRPAAAR
jgi:tetratricopeptide (TPR) repeat protein